MPLFSLAALLFLIVDPIGCIPSIMALIKDFDFATQRRILYREILVALCIGICFQYFGEWFLGLLNVKDYTLRIAGGILLFIVANYMIFSVGRDADPEESVSSKKEPFIFPIATPLLSGPGLLAIIMLQARAEPALKLTSALMIAWVGVFIVLSIAPYLQKILKKNGLIVLEQVMGMLLALVGIEMILNGSAIFLKTLNG